MYTLRFPFRLPESQKISVEERTFEISQKQWKLKRDDNWNILTIDGFQSETEARNFISRLPAGLAWVLLHTGFAADANFELSDITYIEKPDSPENLSRFLGKEPVEGMFDGSRPTVFRTGKKLLALIGGDVRSEHSMPAERFFLLLQEYFTMSEQVQPLVDNKLRVALDLYAAYFTESSGNAKFLTLVMALETLATGITRPQPALELLKKWKGEVEEEKKSFDSNSESWAALDSISNELLFRREDSIRSQIRRLVFTTLNDAGHADAQQTVRKALKIYDHRSTLVHVGKLDPQVLSQAISDAKSIAECVLLARFKASFQSPR